MNEPNVRPVSTTVNITINDQNAFIIANTLQIAIVIKDSNNRPVLSYTMETFYDTFRGKKLEHIHKDIIQYYNSTEEEIFQYNTIMDYNTYQAMVHLYDAVRKIRKNTVESVKLSVLKCIEHAQSDPNINYTITLIE